MRQEANARGNLETAQANAIPSSTASENALRTASANETNVRAGTLDPLAQASIQASGAGARESGARAGLYGTESGIQALGFTNVFGDANTGYSTNPGGPAASSTGGDTLHPATAALMHHIMTGGGNVNGQQLGAGSFGPAGSGIQLLGGQGGGGQLPGAGSLGDGFADPKQPGFYAKGTPMVPGKAPAKGDTDTVPAMLTPGEAVLNTHAAELMGRDKIAKANAVGNAMKKGGMSPQKLAKGTAKVAGKPPPKGLAQALAAMQTLQGGAQPGALPGAPSPMGVAPGMGMR
jgi:hypothetical protein